MNKSNDHLHCHLCDGKSYVTVFAADVVQTQASQHDGFSDNSPVSLEALSPKRVLDALSCVNPGRQQFLLVTASDI